MKNAFLFVVLTLTAQITTAQIKNPDFELKKSPESTLPADWNVVPVQGYSATLVSDTKYSGTQAMQITGQENVSQFLSISQTVAIEVKELKRIKLTAYIKTAAITGSVALWCQLWNAENKQVGFENLGMQGQVIKGTTDWKKYTLTLTVNPSIKKLFFGLYSMGAGVTWADNFAIEEFEGNETPATAAVLKYSKEFNAIVKKHSIYTDSLNWPAIEADLAALGKGLKTVEDAQVLTGYVLQQLRKAGDNHSFYQNKERAQSYASGNTVADTVSAKLVDNNIGYIVVPAFGSVNKEVSEAFAQKIQTLIKQLDTQQDIKGWVVDLRRNGGGNMYPMIAGLKPLIGNGTLGYFVKGKDKNEWKSSVNVKEPYALKKPEPKIAVLVGPRTGSSGEMTAITFIGNKNTKLFGQATAGYVTANGMYALSDGAKLLLASSYSADKNGKKYVDRIYPEVLVKEVAGQDETRKQAIAWLLEK
ncbi:hypothetical protein FA048_04095 [Pedobacter polaris]|uniref:Tail specific protease domain-containing protein n=1 Tax=Pedobacter polaris TaxID=2571273 RepID=A0A4U1CVS8_9SPHI|nr:S41 family peptidase [Pedobacter polaris]TKC12806.1 hypothetical protein FA048_04095 [Pedobacter polaris]